MMSQPFTAVLDLKISNNRHGFAIYQNSSGSFESNTVIMNSQGDGLNIRGNSTVNITDTTVVDNNSDGIDVDNSSADISDSTITGHGIPVGPCPSYADVAASFGSRLTLKANSINILAITCEGTVLSRADPEEHLCP
jgi:parallel beta-helix repeat protein